MAKAVLEHGKDPVLRRLAEEIIVTQQQEIAVMRNRLAAAPADRGDASRAVARGGGGRPVLEADPGEPPGIPVSGRDRVHTSDQTSNTVSVIDPAANRLLS